MEIETSEKAQITQPLYFELAQLEALVAHRVGNKNNEQDLIPSKELLDATDGKLQGLLHRYFLKPFVQPELYHFTFSNGDFKLNPLYSFACSIFDDAGSFLINSVHMAKHLYDLSTHPQIKSGDLFVAAFSNVVVGGESIRAIGIFKSESRQDFLKLDLEKDEFYLYPDLGINIEKLDKGCLIFDLERESGFRVAMVDRVNKGNDAQYWKDQFLQIDACSDSYHHTRELMQCTREFLLKEAPREAPMSKADQIDLLNRTAQYFKEHDQFNKTEFEDEVFQEPAVIEAFRHYSSENLREMPIDNEGGFDISTHAVKKYAKTYKSVLKLDKNFHVYIHGDRNLIEQGRDEDGRKFYKIYYQEEH
jgi:hypothetical protein